MDSWKGRSGHLCFRSSYQDSFPALARWSDIIAGWLIKGWKAVRSLLSCYHRLTATKSSDIWTGFFILIPAISACCTRSMSKPGASGEERIWLQELSLRNKQTEADDDMRRGLWRVMKYKSGVKTGIEANERAAWLCRLNDFQTVLQPPTKRLAGALLERSVTSGHTPASDFSTCGNACCFNKADWKAMFAPFGKV